MKYKPLVGGAEGYPILGVGRRDLEAAVDSPVRL